MQHASTPAAPAQYPAGSEPLSLSWLHPRGMLQLSIVNFLLRLFTLGLYNFWGKTELRARLWSGVRINGEPLAYNGTGWELFVGFAVAMLYIVVPYGSFFAAQLYFGPTSPASIAVAYVFFLVIGWMWNVAFYRARRFRLTRTSWRGIRGDLTGSGSAYAWTAIWTMLIVSISLGWAYPWRQTKLQRILIENTRFGDKPLTFTAGSDSLYGPFALMWLGGLVGYFIMVAMFIGAMKGGGGGAPPVMELPVIFGGLAVFFLILWLAGSWYKTRSFNHYSSNTHFDGVSFDGTATSTSLLWLGLSNSLIAVVPLIVIAVLAVAVALAADIPLASFLKLDSAKSRMVGLVGLLSLGIVGPLVQARTARFWLESLQLKGAMASGPARQSDKTEARMGEGLAQAFDIDVF
jgi:uncharacterized membrane protein YjgN (DUF898 family)